MEPPIVLKSGAIVFQPSYVHETAKIGEGTKISAFCDIGKKVHIGRRCSIQAHVTISNECWVGDDVFIGPNTSLLNDKHFDSRIRGCVILDEAKIGGHCVILPAVTVGRRAIVGAGSIVSKNVLADTIEYNRQTRIVKKREDH